MNKKKKINEILYKILYLKIYCHLLNILLFTIKKTKINKFQKEMVQGNIINSKIC